MKFRLFLIAGLLAFVMMVGCAEHESVVINDQPEQAVESGPPVAKIEDNVETLHGYEISDPYRWLEDGEKAAAWIDGQNAYTEKFFKQADKPGLQESLQNFFRIGYVGDPQLAGDRLFYVKLENTPKKSMDQSALYVVENGKERALVEPEKLDKTGKTALDWFNASPTGRYVAYGLSKDGSENSTLHLLDLTTGKVMDDRIPEARHCSIAWLKDETGFYYTRYEAGKRYNRRIYFHTIGEEHTKDPLIFGEGRAKTDWPGVKMSQDGKTVFVMVFTGATTSDLYLLDHKTKKLTTIAEKMDGQFYAPFFYKGKLYLQTSFESPKGRVIRLDPRKPAPSTWETVIPESEATLTGIARAKNTIVAATIEKAVTKLKRYDFDGKLLGDIPLPMLGSVGSLDVEPDKTNLVFGFSSFLYPPSLLAYDLAKPDVAPKQIAGVWVPEELDFSQYVVKQVMYPSYDGTWIPMFIIHAKGFKPNSQAPTLLYGYGGFDVSMTPYFSRNTLFWITRGGVYAVANLRGGGEFGRAWHEAGMLNKKYQVFEDFEYAMRYLLREGYTTTDKLAIMGGSNGGLLVGALETRAPFLFKAAVGSVGLYDMIRYHKFPPGELWATEYGTSDNPEQVGFLLGYSPYHQLIDGVKYPAFFADTADSDTRVHWLHSAKFIARLQQANASNNPILFYLHKKAGHGQGKSWSDAVKEYADKYRFIMSQVGDPNDQNK